MFFLDDDVLKELILKTAINTKRAVALQNNLLT